MRVISNGWRGLAARAGQVTTLKLTLKIASPGVPEEESERARAPRDGGLLLDRDVVGDVVPAFVIQTG